MTNIVMMPRQKTLIAMPLPCNSPGCEGASFKRNPGHGTALSILLSRPGCDCDTCPGSIRLHPAKNKKTRNPLQHNRVTSFFIFRNIRKHTTAQLIYHPYRYDRQNSLYRQQPHPSCRLTSAGRRTSACRHIHWHGPYDRKGRKQLRCQDRR